jgi:hypothetical protein
VLQIRVRAYDNGTPAKSHVALVIVAVNRNLNAPEFTGDDQTVDILYTQPLGQTIATVTAEDEDALVSGKVGIISLASGPETV